MTSGQPLHRAMSRRRWLMPVAVPALVFGATAALLGWTLWPTVRPVPEVRIAQAVLDISAERAQARPEDTGAARPTGPTVQAPGWLEADPYMIAAPALADGVIEHIDVLEGDRVEAGQVVARLVTDDARLALDRAEAALEIARAERDLARAELHAAETAWEEPIERERAAEATEAEVRRHEAELARLPALIAEAEALLDQREEELRRIRGSVERGAGSDIELVIAEQQHIAQDARVRALHAQRAVLEAALAGGRAEARAARRELELRIEDTRRLAAARAALSRAEASVAHAEVRRDEAALALERTRIRAPAAGIVQRRLKSPGDKVMQAMDDRHSNHVIHIFDPERLQVRVDVPLADAAHVRVGQRCEVVVEVLPDRTFSGQVVRITGEADLQKNTLQSKVRIESPSPILRPEMLARVRFLPEGEAPGEGASASVPAGRVLVPSEAIDTRDGRRVWLVADRRGDRGRLRPVDIERLEDRGAWVLVAGEGLHPGAVLALNPADAAPGRPVRIATENGGTP
jgi:HlyD family secretion protein